MAGLLTTRNIETNSTASPNTLYLANSILCCKYNIVLSQSLSFYGGNLPIAHLLVDALTRASQCRTELSTLEAADFGTCSSTVLSGKQGITDANTSLFLEAICDQADPATYIQRLVSSGHVPRSAVGITDQHIVHLSQRSIAIFSSISPSA